MKFVTVARDVYYTQAHGVVFCLHVGTLAFYFGRRNGPCRWRLELFTPIRWFRWSNCRK